MSKQKYPQASSTTSADGTVTRKGRESYSHAKADAKRNRKRNEADKRQFKYDGMTTEQKLKSLGPTGSTRERARLEKRIASEKVPAVKQPSAKV